MAKSENSKLVRLTVNLIPRAEKAMLLAAELSGNSRTDTVNRALQAYAYLEFITSKGGSVYVREEAGGDLMQILLLGPGTYAQAGQPSDFLGEEESSGTR
jgi:hypothetical protein